MGRGQRRRLVHLPRRGEGRDSRTLRLYGATRKDITNATVTFKAVQGLTFDASTINTISTPGAGALKDSGFTNTVEGLGDIQVSMTP